MIHLDFIDYNPYPSRDIIQIEVLFDEESQRLLIVRTEGTCVSKRSISLLDYLMMASNDEEDILIKDNIIREKLEIRGTLC
jgi:hypothetical protein